MSRSTTSEKHLYHYAQETLVKALKDQGITTSRHGTRKPHRPCPLIHQDDPLPKRKSGQAVPECHPNYGRPDADFQMNRTRCPIPDMPTVSGRDHLDS